MASEAVRCPRDHAPATLLRESGGKYSFFIDYCEHCGGTWLDHGEFAKMAGSKEAERVLEEYASGTSRLHCPRDNAAMALRPVGGIVIDVCPKCHGMWFDRRELDAARKGTDEVLAEDQSPAEPPAGRASIPTAEEVRQSRRGLLLATLGKTTRTQIGWNP